MTVRWLDYPEDHDYPAAADYLGLLTEPGLVLEMVEHLKKSANLIDGKTGTRAALGTKKAKDILRAANLPLLPVDNPHVASDLYRIRMDKKLSPILLIRGSITVNQPLIIADGYHRVCASYHDDENTDIPVVLGRFERGRR